MDSYLTEELGKNPVGSDSTADNSATPISWDQISEEHCYPKLMSQWTSLNKSLPTVHIFQSLKETKTVEQNDSGVESTDDLSSSSCEDKMDTQPLPIEPSDSTTCSDNEEDEIIDVEYVTPPTSLPYNEHKVQSVMYECNNHMNLVRLPLEDHHDGVLEKAILEGSYQQQLLIKKMIEVLQMEHLARLTFVGTDHHAIKQRLSCDKAARRVRKIMADIKWDPKLTHWLHQLLLKSLDNTYLPIYLDILQTLKSTCPTLVEGMIHGGSSGEGSNEAVSLLLKRPWCITVGMSGMDKRVSFDSSPLFFTIPHSISSLGGRRWKSFQNQLSSIGKVFPVVVPDYLRETGQECTPVEAIETLFFCAMSRIQEIKEQYPSRPIVLITWSMACRIACKITEIEKERIACLVNLGVTSEGVDHSWKVSSDPFSSCKTPCIFITGDSGLATSSEYVEELRSKMADTLTSSVIIHGADDLLRLPSKLKEELNITQSVLDRLIQDHIYEFLVYVLPCKFASDIRQQRKRKASSTVDDPIGGSVCSSAQLTPAVPNGTIVLTTHHSHSFTDESLSPVLKGLLGNNKLSPAAGVSGSLGRSNSLKAAFLQSHSSAEFPLSKLPKIGRPPKANSRPRSKSTTVTIDQQKKLVPKNKNTTTRNRSASEEVPLVVPASSSPAADPNSNCNNSNEASPNTLLAITQFQQPSQIRALLPLTPTKNPYENPNQISEKLQKKLSLL